MFSTISCVCGAIVSGWSRPISLTVACIQLFFIEPSAVCPALSFGKYPQKCEDESPACQEHDSADEDMRDISLKVWNHNIRHNEINCWKGWLEKRLERLGEGRRIVGEWEYRNNGFLALVIVGSREETELRGQIGDRFWKALNILSGKHRGTFISWDYPVTGLLDFPQKLPIPQFSICPYCVPDLKT